MWTLKSCVAWTLALLAVPAAVAQSPEQRTRHALDLVLAGKYEAFYAQFSPEMKRAISLQTYAAQAGQITAALGEPQSHDAPQTQHIGDADTVTIPVRWAKTTLNFIVSWNASGQIQGTWFSPPQSKPPYDAPAYSQASSFSSRDITVGDDQWKLPGTLTVPNAKGPWPAVVLVHGSGPNDRDESVGGVKVFRDIAEGLATRGIAVLRYDKRTKVHPQECAADPNFNMTRETVEDAVRAAALLRRQEDIDPRRVFVLGHSQGGYMLPRIMKADPNLAGVILMAGNARPLEDLIVEQYGFLFSLKGELTAAQQARFDAIKQNPWIVLPGATERYKADLKGYYPVALAAESGVPMLILQGERDYQVRMQDFDLWKAGLGGKKNVTMRSYPKLNHLFVAGEGQSTPAEYDQPGHVAPEVIGDIARWMGS
jgi:dienelactone hydrolase